MSGYGGVQMDSAPEPPATPPGVGALRVVTPSQLTSHEAMLADAKRAAKKLAENPAPLEGLAGYVRNKFEDMKRHRNGATGWSQRLMSASRMFNGEYEPDKLAAITQFGGSDIYARVAAAKCRGATALLRDVYMSAEVRPWAIKPSPKPAMPNDAAAAVEKLLNTEVESAQQGGEVLTPDQIEMRRTQIMKVTEDGVRTKAQEEAQKAQRHMDDLLVEGQFYAALGEFLVDLPIFPFAVLKGPVVRMNTQLKWTKVTDPATGKTRNKAVEEQVAKMFWGRVSPYDLWWTPGAADVNSADFVERSRNSKAQLNDLLGVSGYIEENIRKVLEELPAGHVESFDVTDQTRADNESRESPVLNTSGMYDMLEFNGSVTGQILRDFGWDAKKVPDPLKNYAVQVWMIGPHVIKVQTSLNPRKRAPYYITSYEKVPGTLVGNGVTDSISDIQDVCNAALRSLVNNLAMSSGPQVGVNSAMLAPEEDIRTMAPWKIWEFSYEPGLAGSSQRDPILFFQPKSNAAELLAVYEKFTQIADELSAIPRYITGSGAPGGAGRTASGLAMLMNNASKILQTVAGNIDRDVFDPMLQALYDVVMLTDEDGILQGDEEIEVKGVQVAIQKETERQRQIEFLQATNNPIDMAIIGKSGRANVLRPISQNLGLDGQAIVPPPEAIAALEREEKVALAAAAAAQARAGGMAAPGGTDPAAAAQGSQTGGEETGPKVDSGPRVNLQEARSQTPQ